MHFKKNQNIDVETVDYLKINKCYRNNSRLIKLIVNLQTPCTCYTSKAAFH